MLVAAILTLPSSVTAATSCFTLDNQVYCRAWSARNSSMNKSEFVRAGETVDRWQRMVTIIRYSDISTLKLAIPRYMASVRPYMQRDATPQWVVPKQMIHGEESATRLVLATADMSDSEYVVVYFFSDPGKPVYAIIFSQHLPLPSGDIPTQAQYGKWLSDLRAIPARSLAPD
jgi:hypothetical protein